MKKFLTTLILVILLAAVGGGFLLLRFERQQLYHPRPDIHATPAHFQQRFQEVQFTAADGTTLSGWWIPANHPRGTVVFCHGNGGNISDRAHLAPAFTKRGLNLFLWDYRGYGQSAGSPSEPGLYRDARAAFDAAQPMSRNLPIIVYGHSLGAAVACQLARERPVSGLIIEGGFASMADMARRRFPDWPLDRLLTVKYDAAATAAALPGIPKLFGHSPRDEVIPFQSGRLLFAAAAAPKTFTILGGAHSDSSWLTPGQPGGEDLDNFLAQFKP